MKVSNNAAYSDIIEVNTSSPSELGQPFRGLIIVTGTAAASITFNLTTISGATRSGLTFKLPANLTYVLPLAGNDILVTAVTNISKLYAVI